MWPSHWPPLCEGLFFFAAAAYWVSLKEERERERERDAISTKEEDRGQVFILFACLMSLHVEILRSLFGAAHLVDGAVVHVVDAAHPVLKRTAP